MLGSPRSLSSNVPGVLCNALISASIRGEALKQSIARHIADIPSVSQLDLDELGSRQILFVLGSGSSILDLEEANFRFIKDHVSIGINFWIAHSFVPSIYLFYPGGFSDEAVFRRYFKIMEARSAEYSSCPKILTDLHLRNLSFARRIPASFRTNLFAAERFSLYARDAQMMERHLVRLDDAGAFDLSARGRFQGRIFKYGTSLSLAVSIGAILGFKEIVLCGVDLTDSRYFYHESERFPELRNFVSPRVRSADDPHPTNERRNANMMTVSDSLRCLASTILEPRGIRLSVQHERSALSDFLPLFTAEGWCERSSKTDFGDH